MKSKHYEAILCDLSASFRHGKKLNATVMKIKINHLLVILKSGNSLDKCTKIIFFQYLCHL